MKWLKEGNVSLHQQVHKKDFPKITIKLKRYTSSAKDPTKASQNVSNS